jgi:predicted DNA-binding transcriptional regulator AlpA
MNAIASAAFLTSADVEARYQFSRVTVWRAVRDGRLPAPIKLLGGRALRWRLSDLEAWEAAHLPVEQVVSGTSPTLGLACATPHEPPRVTAPGNTCPPKATK